MKDIRTMLHTEYKGSLKIESEVAILAGGECEAELRPILGVIIDRKTGIPTVAIYSLIKDVNNNINEIQLTRLMPVDSLIELLKVVLEGEVPHPPVITERTE